jgi:uncharacterized repeat protein (TIGR01451 family)
MKLRFALAALAASLFAQPAHAVCTAANAYNFAFSSRPAATLNYANSYIYTASNTLGANQNFTVSFFTANLSGSTINGTQMPAIGTTFGGVGTGRTLNIGGTFSGRTTSITGNSRVITVTFTFATPIRDFAMTLHDIDFTSNQFRDWIHVSGTSASGTYVPSLTSPAGNNNGSGARTATASSVRFGAGTTPFVLSSNEGVGVNDSENTEDNTGNITASFAQPVTSVTLRYGNYPYTTGESTTGQQGYGISTISFCPMPQLTVVKSSTPYATTGADRFNAPGSDVLYEITATNSGGSPVDLNGLSLTDLLPPQVTFYNGDFDPLSIGTDPFQLLAGTSGVTMTLANLAFSNNGGSSFAYTPASGYDANINGVRFSPVGTMAANSSFTLRFRARVK